MIGLNVGPISIHVCLVCVISMLDWIEVRPAGQI